MCKKDNETQTQPHYLLTWSLNTLPGTASKIGVSVNDGQSALILTPVKSWFICNQTRNCHMHSDSTNLKMLQSRMNNALTGYIIVLMIIIYLLFIKSIGFIKIQKSASTS